MRKAGWGISSKQLFAGAALLLLCVLDLPRPSALLAAAPDITRMAFTPPVIPEDFAQPVRFEATTSGDPASVAFEYRGVDRPMFDDGTNGDLIARDGTWTLLIQPSEIFREARPSDFFRPVIGYCKPAGSSVRYEVIAETWTSAIPMAPVRQLDATTQETDYVVNFTVSQSEVLAPNDALIATRFYATYPDSFDFLNIVAVTGMRGDRTHTIVKNTVTGIGLSAFDASGSHGSRGRLQGINHFPMSSRFDPAGRSFNQQTGHQWMNFLRGTVFASGEPHWPKGDIARNVTGLSVFPYPPTNEGGTYPWVFTPYGSGGYLVQVDLQPSVAPSTFNSMELYLMGLASPAEVNPFFVLNNQSMVVLQGQVLQPSEFTEVTVNDVIASVGPRVPGRANSRSAFRTATIVLSEQPLDVHAMSLYDWYSRRGEQTQLVPCSEGGWCKPFHQATGGRGTMTMRLRDAVWADIALDFGVNSGLWLRANHGSATPEWLQLHEQSPAHLARGDIDGDGIDELIAGFRPGGVWIWNHSNGWSLLHPSEVSGMVIGDLNGNGRADIVLNFPGQGLWVRYDTQLWKELHHLNPSVMATGQIDNDVFHKTELVADFTGYGEWIYTNDDSWVQLHGHDVTEIQTGDLDGNGLDEIILNFPGQGVWIKSNDNDWSLLNASSAAGMTIGNVDGDAQGRKDLIINFPGHGVYAWMNDATWTLLHPLNASPLSTADLDNDGKDEVVMNFPGYGVWLWKNAAFELVHPADVEEVVVGRFDNK